MEFAVAQKTPDREQQGLLRGRSKWRAEVAPVALALTETRLRSFPALNAGDLPPMGMLGWPKAPHEWYRGILASC
jgi:hypothetical protein